MKIAVTVRGKDAGSPVDLRFGRAPGFLVADTETGGTEYVDNEAGVGAAQGAGVQAVTRIADRGVQALLTGHCGPNAFRALQAAGIQVYTGLIDGSARDAISRFRDGRLGKASAPDVRPHW